MKALKDHTQTELSSLTDTLIQDLIDYECSLRGVKIAVKEPIDPTPPEPPKTETYAKLELGYNLYFTSDDCKKIMEFIVGFPTFNLAHVSDYNSPEYIEPDKDPSINIRAKAFFSQSDAIEYANSLKRVESLIEAYKKDTITYENAVKAKEEIEKEVYSTINTAKSQTELIKERADILAKYIMLANGDKNIAYNFYTLAYGHHMLEEAKFYLQETLTQEDIRPLSY